MFRVILLSLLFCLAPGKQERYKQLKDEISVVRTELAREYKNSSRKDTVLKHASSYLLSLISDSMSYYWENTDWEFSGKTETPGQGSIACGYFVTTVLRDAGFKLDRIRLAETYSEKMIRAIVRPQYVKRYQPYNHFKFIEDIRRQGDGLYIVGLDFHTGFIICRNREVYFLHSNYTSRVMKEIALGSPVLSRNEYAVTGKLSADTVLLGQWLRNEACDKKSNQR